MDELGAAGYGDGFADVYDEWYGDLAGLDDCIGRLAALAARHRPAPVLELGVGTGRVALPLRARGVEVAGLDASAAMVTRLRAKPGGAEVPVVVADMAAPPFRPAPTFGVMVATYNTFFTLDDAAQRGCLAAASALLADDGVVVIEGFVPPAAADRPRSSVEVSRLEHDEVVLLVSRDDPARGVLEGQHVQIRTEGIRLRPWQVRYRTTEELDALATDVGLELRWRWSDWTGAPWRPDDPVAVSGYCRPGAGLDRSSG